MVIQPSRGVKVEFGMALPELVIRIIMTMVVLETIAGGESQILHAQHSFNFHAISENYTNNLESQLATRSLTVISS